MLRMFYIFFREGGHMCAIKEVPVVSDDNNSRECLRQLNQVGLLTSIFSLVDQPRLPIVIIN